MKCGLIGEKLSHSYSKIIHEKIADYSYELYPMPPEQLPAFLAGDFRGMNVTIPYKKEVIPYCATLSDTAKAIGSVNTLIKDSRGQLHGYNTDYFGMTYMARRAGIDFSGKKVVILGSGGTCLTARYTAQQGGARQIVVVSRKGENNYENLHLHRDADILIHTTPVGMFPKNGQSVVDLEQFPNCSGVLDVIYNPLRTYLIQQAQEKGIPCCGGLPMLVAQAVRAYELFSKETAQEGCIEKVLSDLERDITNLVLIGMPGSGKKAVGSRLAKRLHREFLDTDALIRQEFSMTAAEIYARFGPERFRQMEATAAMAAGKLSGRVIATGSGIVLSKDSLRALRQNGRLIYLMRDCSRLSSQGKPLLMGKDAVQELFVQRDPLYRAACDTEISNNGLITETIKTVLQNM